MKQLLKRIRPLVAWNGAFKCKGQKLRYRQLCGRYGSPSVIDDPKAVTDLTRRLFRQAPERRAAPVANRPSVLFVGTDAQQDYSGLVQALQQRADVVVLQQGSGKHGQRWPAGPHEYEVVRRENGETIRRYLRERRFDVLIGQMWAVSVDPRALAEAKDNGVAVVNISMDDRHAFLGPALADGADGGTRGLAPHLTLACTAAAECVRWYEMEGCPALFFPEATDGAIFSPAGVEKDIDVSFVGGRYGVRESLVAALERAGVRVHAFGAGWPAGRIPTQDVPRLFARSRVILGCGTIGHCDDFYALKLRDFDAPSSGSLYLTNDNPDLHGLFDVGREMATFTGIDDAVERVRHFLRNQAEREEIAAAGRLKTSTEHQWAARFEQLFSRLELTT